MGWQRIFLSWSSMLLTQMRMRHDSRAQTAFHWVECRMTQNKDKMKTRLFWSVSCLLTFEVGGVFGVRCESFCHQVNIKHAPTSNGELLRVRLPQPLNHQHKVIWCQKGYFGTSCPTSNIHDPEQSQEASSQDNGWNESSGLSSDVEVWVWGHDADPGIEQGDWLHSPLLTCPQIWPCKGSFCSTAKGTIGKRPPSSGG